LLRAFLGEVAPGALRVLTERLERDLDPRDTCGREFLQEVVG
jgi:hypothetical protein